jgi:hypothetical protein
MKLLVNVVFTIPPVVCPLLLVPNIFFCALYFSKTLSLCTSPNVRPSFTLINSNWQPYSYVYFNLVKLSPWDMENRNSFEIEWSIMLMCLHNVVKYFHQKWKDCIDAVITN